jgi:hypothetical protein
MPAMQKEVDHVYKWLTSEKHHLKKNCKRKPPYDWSDIMEKSKDEAISAIARNGTEHTSYYWNLAGPTEDCSNWLATWFLYHKFRYRDGRNRNAVKDEGSYSHSSISKHSHHKHSRGGEGKQHGENDSHQDHSYYSGSYSGSTTYGTSSIYLLIGASQWLSRIRRQPIRKCLLRIWSLPLSYDAFISYLQHVRMLSLYPSNYRQGKRVSRGMTTAQQVREYHASMLKSTSPTNETLKYSNTDRSINDNIFI